MLSVTHLEWNERGVETFVGRLTDVMVAEGEKVFCCYTVLVRKEQQVWGYHMQIKKFVIIKRLYFDGVMPIVEGE